MVEIQVHDKFGIRNIKIPYTALCKPEMFVEVLANHRVLIKQDYEIIMQRYLRGQTRFVQGQGGTLLYYKELGWQNIAGSSKKEFVLGGYATKEAQYKFVDTSFSFTRGTLEGQVDFLTAEILPYKETRLALVSGLSSIVAGYVEEFKSIRFTHYQR